MNELERSVRPATESAIPETTVGKPATVITEESLFLR